MKQKLSYTLGIIVLVMMVLATSSAKAGNPNVEGPYYTIPSWTQTLPADKRFVMLTNMANTAVLDKETGLVWEQSPATYPMNWYAAQYNCSNLAVGNRKGWRLPTIQELASLVDPSVSSPGPTLPSGHPFSNVQSSYYWSATTYAGSATEAFTVYFDNGVLSHGNKMVSHNAWCVRGGQGVDPQ